MKIRDMGVRGGSVFITSMILLIGAALVPVIQAGEKSLEIVSLILVPASVPVNRPFDFKVTFVTGSPVSSGSTIRVGLYFKISKNSRTLFTSESYLVDAKKGEIKTWVTHMNPVSAEGEYTISAYLNYEDLAAHKSIKLTIGGAPEHVETSTEKRTNGIVLLGQSPPSVSRESIVHVRHILVKTEAEAYGLLSRMKGLRGKSLKESFIASAKSRSIGPSGKNGGDLGFIERGRMAATFEEAAFTLSVGAVTSSPVKTVYGYHLIYREQ